MKKRGILHKNNVKHSRSEVLMLSRPYSSSKIVSIPTGRTGVWKYSPKWKEPIKQTKINLTGYRRKDYKEAEKNTGVVHKAKATVWHHVWEKDLQGLYTIQLVDYIKHQKACPHAGGCKRWILETGASVYRNVNIYVNNDIIRFTGPKRFDFTNDSFEYSRNSQPSYMDLIIDYIFDERESEEDQIHLGEAESQMFFSIKHTSKALGMERTRKGSKVVLRKLGIDPYGNVFYLDNKNEIYFYDHERASLIVTGISIQELTT